MSTEKPWVEFTNQKQWEAYLKKLVRTNEKALLRALVLIYKSNTPTERAYGGIIDADKRGFTEPDFGVLSPLAEKVIAGEKLTIHEYRIARRRMPKYWRQLMIISKQKMQEESLQQSLDDYAIEGEQISMDDLAGMYVPPEGGCEHGISCEYGICDECSYNMED